MSTIRTSAAAVETIEIEPGYAVKSCATPTGKYDATIRALGPMIGGDTVRLRARFSTSAAAVKAALKLWGAV